MLLISVMESAFYDWLKGLDSSLLTQTDGRTAVYSLRLTVGEQSTLSD